MSNLAVNKNPSYPDFSGTKATGVGFKLFFYQQSEQEMALTPVLCILCGEGIESQHLQSI